MGLPCRRSSSSRMDTRSKEIVPEAHKYATGNEPTSRDIYATKLGKIPRSPVNRGVTCRRDAGDTRPTKMDVLEAAIVESPYLLHKIQCQQRLGKQTWRYRVRQSNFEKFEEVLGRASAGVAAVKQDIFGDWGLCPTSWSSGEPTDQGWGETDDRERTREPWSTSSVEMTEPVDVESLRRYFQSGADSRPDQLDA